MLAKYNGKYYCAMNYGEKMHIWRYPVEKLNTEEGYVFPNEELTVRRDDIEEIFYAFFSTVWSGKKCTATMPIDHSYITLLLDVKEKEFAEAHDFFHRKDDCCEYYTKDVSIEELTEFYFDKTILTPNDGTGTPLLPYKSEHTSFKMSMDEWTDTYHKMDYKPHWSKPNYNNIEE